MRKNFAMLLIVTGLTFLITVSALANNESQSQTSSEIIVEEDTPETSAKTRNTWIVIYGMMFVLTVGFVSLNLTSGNQKLSLEIFDVEDNGDGSFVVKVGCKNLTNSTQEIDKNNTKITMKKGTAIVLEKKDISNFSATSKQELVTLAISDNSNVEIFVEGEKIVINKELIENWRNEHVKN
jgi:hypothetical protein